MAFRFKSQSNYKHLINSKLRNMLNMEFFNIQMMPNAFCDYYFPFHVDISSILIFFCMNVIQKKFVLYFVLLLCVMYVGRAELHCFISKK